MIKDSSNLQFLRVFGRQIRLSNIGLEGQLKLMQSKVLIIGVGGLGCPAVLSLMTMGVGNIGLVDGDIVELSNLHRQTLFCVEDVGKCKASCAKERLEKYGFEIDIHAYDQFLNKDLAETIFPLYDVIVDATDGLEVKYIIGQVAKCARVPVVFASVNRYEGQFALLGVDKDWVTYEDIFPYLPPRNFAANCSSAGVLGVIPTSVSTFQTIIVVAYLIGDYERYRNKLYYQNFMTFENRPIRVRKRLDGPTESTCKKELGSSIGCSIDLELEVNSLQSMDRAAKIIDIRESHERHAVLLSSIHLAVSDFERWEPELEKERPYLFVCQSGKRSMELVLRLRQNGFVKTYSYQGGMNQAIDRENDLSLKVNLKP